MNKERLKELYVNVVDELYEYAWEAGGKDSDYFRDDIKPFVESSLRRFLAELEKED